MSALQIVGRVEHGQFKPSNPDWYRNVLARFNRGPVVVTMSRPKAQRSLDQNAYWWAVPVKLIAEHCGYTDSQMHYALLGECFGYTEGPTGKPVPVKPSSSDLTVDEFRQLIDWVLTWAPSELGVVIPAPDEVPA